MQLQKEKHLILDSLNMTEDRDSTGQAVHKDAPQSQYGGRKGHNARMKRIMMDGD